MLHLLPLLPFTPTDHTSAHTKTTTPGIYDNTYATFNASAFYIVSATFPSTLVVVYGADLKKKKKNMEDFF